MPVGYTKLMVTFKCGHTDTITTRPSGAANTPDFAKKMLCGPCRRAALEAICEVCHRKLLGAPGPVCPDCLAQEPEGILPPVKEDHMATTAPKKAPAKSAPAPKTATAARRKKLSHTKKLAVRFGKLRHRIEQLAKKLDTLSAEASSSAKQRLLVVQGELEGVEKLLNELPDTPPKSSPKQIEVGSVVAVRENKRADYAMINKDPKEFENMKVEKVEGSKVLLTTPSGTRMVLPRGHIVIHLATL